jgi:SAM-dependent methyltransferase
VKGGYDPAFFDRICAVEDRHFWFRARNRMIARLLAQAVAGLPSGYRVLEVGCGDGNVLRFLQEACRDGIVVGMDYFAEGLRLARRRSDCALVQGDMARPPFSAGFHIVGIFDVLEHLSDDRGALRLLWHMLEPGGALLLTTPAAPSLWSDFDVASGHCRRYERAELEGKLVAAGFRVERLSHAMATIYPLVWWSRRGRTRKTTAAADAVHDELRIVPVLNEALAFVLSREADWIAGGRSLPFGTSLVAVARKL